MESRVLPEPHKYVFPGGCIDCTIIESGSQNTVSLPRFTIGTGRKFTTKVSTLAVHVVGEDACTQYVPALLTLIEDVVAAVFHSHVVKPGAEFSVIGARLAHNVVSVL